MSGEPSFCGAIFESLFFSNRVGLLTFERQGASFYLFGIYRKQHRENMCMKKKGLVSPIITVVSCNFYIVSLKDMPLQFVYWSL